jgi:hypothetical protein
MSTTMLSAPELLDTLLAATPITPERRAARTAEMPGTYLGIITDEALMAKSRFWQSRFPDHMPQWLASLGCWGVFRLGGGWDVYRVDLARVGEIACVDPVDDPGVGLVDAAAMCGVCVPIDWDRPGVVDPDGTVIRRRSNAANRALAGLGLELCRSVSGEDVVWTVRRIATNQGTCDLEG